MAVQLVLPYQEKTVAELRIAKLHLNKLQAFWKMSSGWTRPKWRGLSIMHSIMFWEKQTRHIRTNISYQLSMAMAEWGVIWAYFATTGPGHLEVIGSTTNSFVNQSIIESSVKPCLTANVLPKLWYVTGAQRQSKSRPQSDWNAVHKLCPQTSMNWSDTVKKSVQKFLHSDLRDWKSYRSQIFK